MANSLMEKIFAAKTHYIYFCGASGQGNHVLYTATDLKQMTCVIGRKTITNAKVFPLEPFAMHSILFSIRFSKIARDFQIMY